MVDLTWISHCLTSPFTTFSEPVVILIAASTHFVRRSLCTERFGCICDIFSVFLNGYANRTWYVRGTLNVQRTGLAVWWYWKHVSAFVNFFLEWFCWTDNDVHVNVLCTMRYKIHIRQYKKEKVQILTWQARIDGYSYMIRFTRTYVRSAYRILRRAVLVTRASRINTWNSIVT